MSAFGQQFDRALLDVIVDSTTTPGTTYIGWAPIGSPKSSPVWRIKREYTSGNETLIGYAMDNWPGSVDKQVWDDRTTLTYTK